MADGPRPRFIRGCEACRVAHAKCDTQLPSCGRCVLLKRECIREVPFPFRHSNLFDSSVIDPGERVPELKAEFEFADDQIWITPPGNVEFIFEYFPTDDGTDERSSGPISPGRPVSNHTLSPSSPTPPLRTTGRTPGFGVAPASLSSHHRIWTPEQPESGFQDTPSGGSNSTGTEFSTTYSPITSKGLPRTPASLSSGARHWPLADEQEAMLLRHFVTNLSKWFDYCDPHHTFATSVVQCAIVSRPLLFAILATSARHLSVISGHDGYVADRYHRECLSLLIPVLDQSNAALDAALFAATVILRLYEEISVPFAGQDSESHLMGTHTFVRAQEYHPSSGIRQAIFRVILRQEIVIAFRTQRPVQLLREYIQVDRSLERTDDWILAFHIIVLCAEILNYCYGDDPKSPEAWKGLAERAKSWMDTKPVQFEPLLYRAHGSSPEDQVFPEIWLLSDCQVAAHQHFLICQILLVAHDPKRPQLGPGRAEAIEATNRVIRDHVRRICGIALSNPEIIPSMFTASLVIGVTGDLFSDYREQQAMMDILVRTDTSLAWPTASVQEYLRGQWGWNR